MTTRIEIKNTGHGNVEVFALDAEFKKIAHQGDTTLLPPGATVSKYVWKDTAIVIQEQE